MDCAFIQFTSLLLDGNQIFDTRKKLCIIENVIQTYIKIRL